MIETTLRIASVISSLALLICFVLYRAGTFDAVPKSEKPIFSSSKYSVVAPSTGQPQPNSSAEPDSVQVPNMPVVTKDGPLQSDDVFMLGSKSGDVFMSGSKSFMLGSKSGTIIINWDALVSGAKSGTIKEIEPETIEPWKKDFLPFEYSERK